MKIISEREEATYSFQGIQNLTNRQHMIYIHHAYFDDLQNSCYSEGIQIKADFENFFYKIAETYPTYQNSTLKVRDIQKLLQQLVIVVQKVQTIGEALVKVKILKEQQIKEHLSRILGCEDLRIIHNQEIDSDQFPDFFLPEICDLSDQANTIIFIINNQKQKQINQLLGEINEFISNPNYIITKTVLQKASRDVFEQFGEQLQQLKNQSNEVQIEIEQISNAVQISLITWVSKDNQGQMDRKVQQIQEVINEFIPTKVTQHSFIKQSQSRKQESCIFNANVIEVSVTESIEQWEIYLNKKLKNENLIIKKKEEASSIQIFFIGNREQIQKLKKSTQQEITNTELSIREVIYDKDNNLIQELLLDQQYQLYFNSQLSNQFSKIMCEVKIFEVIKENHIIQILLSILHAKEEGLIESILQYANNFFQELRSLEIAVGIQSFIEFYKIDDLQQFCSKQSMVYKRMQNKDIFIGFKSQIGEIDKMLQAIKQKQEGANKPPLQQSQIIAVPNKLVYQQLQDGYQQQKLGLPDQCSLLFPYNTNQIIVRCFSNDTLKESISIIEKLRLSFSSKICTQTIQVDKKSLEFFQGEGFQKIKQIEESLSCKISLGQMQSNFTQNNEAIIKFNGKKLVIKNGALPEQNCDLMVIQTQDYACLNNINNLSQTIQRSINVFGNQLQQICQNTISKLSIDGAYVFPGVKDSRNILFMALPIFKYGTNDSLEKHQEMLLKNISKIFEKAKYLCSKSIALKISGCGSCNNSLQYVSQAAIINIINCFFSNDSSVEIVYILEEYEPRYLELKAAVNLLLYPQRRRQIKYSWQWNFNESAYKSYEYQINSQIDYVYEVYQNNQTQNKFQLEFSFIQFPFTHEINLTNLTVKDLKKRTLEKLEFQINKGKMIYSISKVLIDERLNNYMNLQLLENELIFQVCLDQYFIVFQGNKCYQENSSRQQRNVIKSPLSIKMENYFNHFLLGKNFILDEANSKQKQMQHQTQIEIQAMDNQMLKLAINEIKQISTSNIKLYRYHIPNLFDEEIVNLKRLIKESSISVQGEIEGGQDIEITILGKELQKLEFNLSVYTQCPKQYPNYWNPQKEIVGRVILQPTSPEYQIIAQRFKETDNGQIYQIKRIQNKILWENYSSEVRKLKKFHQTIGYHMSQIEETRYIWHGVRSQHPGIIYQGLKEGFNCTFSNAGMWGPGIYFAQNASYSRNYSYQLQMEEGQQHQGRLIMLCSLVTTGRVDSRNPDQNIKAPKDGFDSVSGFTNGSTVFILYSMDIRRAYPAYEVIFT